MPKKQEASPSHHRTFWLPDTLYEQISDYVSRHRNAPDNLSINQFVRDALEGHLEKLSKKGKR